MNEEKHPVTDETASNEEKDIKITETGNQGFRDIPFPEVANRVADMEQGEQEVNIAQINETLKCVLEVFSAEIQNGNVNGVLKLIQKY